MPTARAPRMSDGTLSPTIAVVAAARPSRSSAMRESGGPGGGDAELVQALTKVVAGGARVVRDERKRAPASVERREGLAGTRVEDAPVPHTPVEVEDESPEGPEKSVGHEPQTSAERAK